MIRLYIEGALNAIDSYYKEKEHQLIQYGHPFWGKSKNMSEEIKSYQDKRRAIEDLRKVMDEDKETLKKFGLQHWSREYEEKNNCRHTRRLAPARLYEVCKDGVDIIHPTGRIKISTELLTHILNASLNRIIKIEPEIPNFKIKEEDIKISKGDLYVKVPNKGEDEYD